MADSWKIWLLVLALTVGGCDRREVAPRTGGMEGPALWVWHRSSALSEREVADLDKAGVRVLFWQVAEMGWGNGEWRVANVSGRQREVVGLEIFPVVRIEPEAGFLEDSRAAGALAGWLREWAGEWAGEAGLPEEVQVDFDCPGRLLGRYAGFLKDLKKELGEVRVSATALASWVGLPDFGKLAGAVSSFSPMFYDLEGDEASEVARGNFRPMADAEGSAWVRRWRSCKVPWRAGLPNFERVSVFAAGGKLRGHLRGWSHDALVFHPDLEAEALGAGVTRLRVAREVEIAGTRVSPGEILVHRMPEEGALREMKEAAREAGARSVIYFALPGPGLQASYSARHLAAAGGEVELALEYRSAGEVVLRNVGTVDLPVRLEGWELMLRSEELGAFRSAGPGEFGESRVEGGLPAEAAGELVLRFAKLAAGERIVSGAVVAKSGGLQWRVAGVGEEWRALDLE